MTAPARGTAALGLLSAALLLVIASAGWMGDDAFITLRVVDNLWHGYGLRWNAIERVQVYTHPLWMLVLSAVYGLTREPHWTTIATSLALTAATLGVVTTQLARTTAAAGLALALLAGSKAFVEFSTSGLENPLSHLLLAALAAVAWSPAPRPARLSTLAALLALCRLDLLALIAPLWLHGAARTVGAAPAATRRSRVVALAAGWWPLAAWLLFALVYYGTVTPNTALAKLPANVPWIDFAAQGTRYLRDSVVADPVTLLTIGSATAHACATSGARSTGLALGLGLAVVVMVGGDFMSGRFLTPAFVLAVCHLARHASLQPRPAMALAAAVLGLAVVMPESPLRVWRHAIAEERLVSHGAGIVDERAIYAPFTGVWGRDPAEHPWARGGRSAGVAPRVITYEAVGFLGFYAGPGVHVLDPMALTDPLLARLPIDIPWRIGHFKRSLPDGYEASARACLAAAFPGNAIAPPSGTCPTGVAAPPASTSVAALHAHVVALSRLPITDPRRPAAIWRELTGGANAR